MSNYDDNRKYAGRVLKSLGSALVTNDRNYSIDCVKQALRQLRRWQDERNPLHIGDDGKEVYPVELSTAINHVNNTLIENSRVEVRVSYAIKVLENWLTETKKGIKNNEA